MSGIILFALCWGSNDVSHAQTITPSSFWKNSIDLPNERFASFPTASLRWIKFTILTAPYDPSIVYYQHTGRTALHHTFAATYLDLFLDISAQDYYQAVLVDDDPPAVLGTVLIPPKHINEYAIQFVRYNRGAIRDFFFTVKQSIAAPEEAKVFLFPTFEQQAAAEADRSWFAAQGITISSPNRWAQGNVCYAEGWALGTLKYIPSTKIVDAYQNGELTEQDILLTDGVPAEIPTTAGVISLAPSTPNSHVAIMSRTYSTPFLYLALNDDATRAQALVGRRVLLSAYEDLSGICETFLLDTEGLLNETLEAQILLRKILEPLSIEPMTAYGAYGAPTDHLIPADTRFFGGKAAHFGILRQAIAENSPRALALSFDLWQSFLNQPLPDVPILTLDPGQYLVVYADSDKSQGPTHSSFKLSKGGESIALIDRDGVTVLDVVHFGTQQEDLSYGRTVDGSGTWQSLTSPTPGRANAAQIGAPTQGLAINEFMAANATVLEDPCEPGEYPDWIELYNGSHQTLTLNGLYLTDNLNEPTQWQFPVAIKGNSLRREITRRLAAYPSYPPGDIQGLWTELNAIRTLFKDSKITTFTAEEQSEIMTLLTDPLVGYDTSTRLRFRSSTNVEDSEDYTGAGLYDSFSGCPAATHDNEEGLHGCDPNKTTERDVFQALRRTMASFYNDNAYLERLRRNVNEEEVGMGILVHPSFLDTFERANGVATVAARSNEGTWTCTLVTQQGATSVTNPIDRSTPEEVIVVAKANRALYAPNASGNLTPLKNNSVNGIQAYSSLLPLGATVMDWTDDYGALVNLLLDVSDRFASLTGKTNYTLDLEYKKVAPGDQNLPEGGLVVKQARQVPEPNNAVVRPFLVGGSATYEIFTGEFAEAQNNIDVFANHRLKSLWQLAPHNMLLDANNLSQRLHDRITVERIGTDLSPVTNDITPETYHFNESEVYEQWQIADGSNPRTYRLTTSGIPMEVTGDENPFFTLPDLGTVAYTPARVFTLQVNYKTPVYAWTRAGLSTTLQNTVHLWPRLAPQPDDVQEERSGTMGQLTVHTRFYRPASLRFRLPSWDFNSTAPISRFDQTTIEGVTTEPIILTDYYAQTYRPEHHNLTEHFLFEPQLDPMLSTAQLTELQTQNIRMIHLIVNNEAITNERVRIQTYGF